WTLHCKKRKNVVAVGLSFSWISIVPQLVLDLLYGLLPQPQLDIALTDDEPIFHKPRRLPFAERDIVDAQVDEWVKNGIVEPCSSPYASQVVVVKKKTGNQEFALIIDA
ncbi:uncharacterized protein K02A2.6-like, partial [Trichonephila clavipes]